MRDQCHYPHFVYVILPAKAR